MSMDKQLDDYVPAGDSQELFEKMNSELIDAPVLDDVVWGGQVSIEHFQLPFLPQGERAWKSVTSSGPDSSIR